MIDLDSNNFDEVVKDGVVLVDFWAPWCQPCKASLPHIEALVNEGLKVVKVNVDDFSDVAEKFNVRSVPTFILFKDGVEVKRRTGAASKAMLQAFVNEV